MLQDDGVLRVYADVDEAVRDVEALDIADVLRAAFDEDARPYHIEWIELNRTSSLLGIQAYENGRYTLVASGSPNPDALLSVIRRAALIEPAPARAFIRDLEERFSSKP